MYVDLLSQQNHINVNKKVIKLFGRDVAIYWAELMVVSTQVLNKKKYNEEGYFKLNRKYIEEQTTLTIEEQITCDAVLQKAGVLEENSLDPNLIRVNLEAMASIILTEDPKILKSVAKSTKLSSKSKGDAKREGVKIGFRNCINVLETDEELRQAYYDWITSIVDNKKPLSKPVLTAFVQDVRSYSSDKAKQIELINMAALKAYAKVEWTVKVMNKPSYSSSATRLNQPQVVATAVSSVEF